MKSEVITDRDRAERISTEILGSSLTGVVVAMLLSKKSPIECDHCHQGPRVRLRQGRMEP